MSLKKIVLSIAFLIFLTGLTNIYSQDQHLSKFYLEKAYSFYNNSEFDAARDVLVKVKEYSTNFPEYYYIDNLIIDKTTKALNLEESNADRILINLDNSYLIDKYFLVKNAAMVYKSVRAFEKANKAFQQLLFFRERLSDNDFHEYVQLLFDSKNKGLLKLIIPVINKAKELFDNLDYDYYSLLYEILYTKIEYNDFFKKYNALNSNYYSKEKLLYLRSLYYNSQKSLISVYDEYFKLKQNNGISEKYKINVLYNLLLKNKNLTGGQLTALLKEWDAVAQSDYRSIDIINNKFLLDIINKDAVLKKNYLNYSKERYLDDDEDGRWEKLFKYKNGVLVENIIDSNQDGIYEYKTDFYDDGKINAFYAYKNSNSIYSKFIFNHNDQSLNSIEYYNDDKKTSTDYVEKSQYFPTLQELMNIGNKIINRIITQKENFADIHSITKYYDSKIVYVDYDRDNDNFFEERDFYKDGMLDEVLKDLNEDGIYELYEKYKNGKLDIIKYKTNEQYELYDYLENVYADRTEKYWDNDLDGIYEIKIIDYNNKNSIYYFDVDFDKIYDFSVEIINGVKKMYKLTNNGEILLKEYYILSNKKEFKWNIISSRDINGLSKPDDILIKDKKSVSGIFIYKSKENIFKNGQIKTNDFDYKIIIINGIVYLFDLSE